MGKYDGMGLGEYLEAKKRDDAAAASARRIDTIAAASPTSASNATTVDGVYTPGYNPTYLDPGTKSGDHYAANTRARLARAQWNDYKARYKPVEDMLLNNVTSGERLDAALGKGTEALDQQYGISDGTFQRNLSRHGIGLSPLQQEQHSDRMGLSKKATEANLRNSTRRTIADSNMGLMTGMSGTRGEVA